MGTISTVLFPTDFSECSNAALRHALHFCSMFDAKLILFHVMVLFGENPEKIKEGFPELEKLIEYYKQQNEEYIETYRKILHEHVVPHTEKIIRGFSVAEEILRFEKENKVDLIVMGTHGRGLLRHFVLGSEAEKVTRYSSCPVLTVCHFGKQIEIVETYRRILAPLDFSDYSKAGLKYAIVLAEAFDAAVTIIHVYDAFPHPSMYLQGIDSPILLNPEIKSKSEEIIRNTVKEINPDFERYTTVILDGKPFKKIIEYAEENDTDLIVISTRGLGAVESFFIGTTADKIIRKVKCPVLAVKEHERDFL